MTTEIVKIQPRAMSAMGPVGNVNAYIAQVNSIPMLTLEQEQSLATRFIEKADIEAAQELVLAHLRFVVRVARGYQGYGLALADLIQEGNIGLMKAVKRFNPEVGVRLVSFAVHWIKAEIHEFVLRNWRIVKVATTKAQRKLFFNLRGMKKRLGWFTKEEVEGVAQELGVTTQDVLEMESRLNAYDATFDAPANDDDEANAYSPSLYLTSQSLDPSDSLEADNTADDQQERLQNALMTLDDRSRDIVASRWLVDKKSTLHDLADKYQVSAERIRQLEANAMKKIKAAVVA